MRFTFFVFLFSFVFRFTADAQRDSLKTKDQSVLNPVDPNSVNPFLPDSLTKANRKKFIEDSLAMNYLIPDSSKMGRFGDSLMKTNLYDIFSQRPGRPKKTGMQLSGRPRSARNPWIILLAIGLLVYAGLLNLFFSNDIKNVFQSFYHKHALSQTDKEGGLINSWAFMGLFLLFCLSLSLLLYQLTRYFHVDYGVTGVQLFMSIAAATCILAALKFVILKLIGFIFDIGSVTSGYIAVLNLTYASLAFVVLAAAICLSLIASAFIPSLLIFTFGSAVIIWVWQYLRNSLNIISDFRFHKFYLFIYLCALEICPVLILIKALDI